MGRDRVTVWDIHKDAQVSTGLIESLARAIERLSERGRSREFEGVVVVDHGYSWGFVADDVVLAGYPPVIDESLIRWIEDLRIVDPDLRPWVHRNSGSSRGSFGEVGMWVTFAVRRSPRIVFRHHRGDWEGILRAGFEEY